jgi:hypothetical protein
MNILINGASNNVGSYAWPYQLQKLLNCELTNLSIPGCGNDYVHDTTINKLGERKYDLVIIMWPSIPLRIDWKVDNIQQFGSDAWTSVYHTDKSPDAEADWILGGSHIVDESMNIPVENRSILSKKFADFYSVVKPHQLMRSALIKMVSLQGVLKAHGIPHVFTYTAPIKNAQRFNHLEQMLDKEYFYNGEYLTPLCLRKGYYDPDDPMKHATEPGHIEFAELLLEHLKNKKYV